MCFCLTHLQAHKHTKAHNSIAHSHAHKRTRTRTYAHIHLYVTYAPLIFFSVSLFPVGACEETRTAVLPHLAPEAREALRRVGVSCVPPAAGGFQRREDCFFFPQGG